MQRFLIPQGIHKLLLIPFLGIVYNCVKAQAVDVAHAPSPRPLPPLPLLTAFEKDLTVSAARIEAQVTELKGVDGQLADVAWIDDKTLLVRSESPGFGDAQSVFTYVWPINGKPQLTVETGRTKTKLGSQTLYTHTLQAGTFSLRRTLQGMETVNIKSPAKNQRSPIVDWGV